MDKKIKIRAYSDTHLDWYAADFHQTKPHTPGEEIPGPQFWYPKPLPDDKETILVLAGDLWIGTHFIEYCGRYYWIGELSKQFKQVLIVLGNHDYWPLGNNTITIKNGGDKCNALLQDMGFWNVHVLDMGTWQHEDVLFVGATLWTDMDKCDALAMHNMPKFMRYDGSIAYETGPNGQWSRFTSDKWVQTHMKHRDYIKHVVEQNRDKRIVVATHHIPLLTLGDPQFKADMSNAYYASDLSDFILDNEHIKLWFYGHTHYQNDVMLGGTRLINNCVGYQGQHFEQQGLVKHEIIEL